MIKRPRRGRGLVADAVRQGTVMSLSRTETVIVSQWLASPGADAIGARVKVAFHEMVLAVVW